MKLQHWLSNPTSLSTPFHKKTIFRQWIQDIRRSPSQNIVWTLPRSMMLLGLFYSAMLTLPWLVQTIQSYTLPVRVEQWLEVRQVLGDVKYSHSPHHQELEAAIVGQTRLQHVGDRIKTGEESETTLAVDTGIGFVKLADNTDLYIDEINVTPGGGRLTRLSIPQGQARLEVRPFLNPESELEIRTPAGVSGVRGTRFGVGVNPNGQTGVLTEEGQVSATAQGVTVYINEGLQSLIVPGKAPTSPIAITDNVTLDIIDLRRSGNGVYIRGSIDPFSQLTIDHQPQNVEPNGQFEIIVPRHGRDRIPAKVSTLSGNKQDYELAVP